MKPKAPPFIHEVEPVRRYFITIKYKVGDDGRGQLSISSVDGPKRNGDCTGGCGQYMNPLTNEDRPPLTGWNRDTMRQLAEVWNRWHLNNMRAGCEHQRANWGDVTARVETEKGPRPRCQTYPTEHPDGVLTKPCEVCGYKYGSEWLYEEVPVNVLKWLQSLPPSTHKNPWRNH